MRTLKCSNNGALKSLDSERVEGCSGGEAWKRAIIGVFSYFRLRVFLMNGVLEDE